jgi:hypothetical protein
VCKIDREREREGGRVRANRRNKKANATHRERVNFMEIYNFITAEKLRIFMRIGCLRESKQTLNITWSY